LARISILYSHAVLNLLSDEVNQFRDRESDTAPDVVYVRFRVPLTRSYDHCSCILNEDVVTYGASIPIYNERLPRESPPKKHRNNSLLTKWTLSRAVWVGNSKDRRSKAGKSTEVSDIAFDSQLANTIWRNGTRRMILIDGGVCCSPVDRSTSRREVKVLNVILNAHA